MNPPGEAGPLLIDLFCGRGGWSRVALELGWRVIGYDIEDHGFPGELRQVRLPVPVQQLRQLGPALVVASPPCEEFARAWLPWLRCDRRPARWAVDLLRWSVALPAFFDCPVVVECSKFAARHVPGAQLFGSWALWGDVPALCPVPLLQKQRLTGESPAARAQVPRQLAEWILTTARSKAIRTAAAS